MASFCSLRHNSEFSRSDLHTCSIRSSFNPFGVWSSYMLLMMIRVCSFPAAGVWRSALLCHAGLQLQRWQNDYSQRDDERLACLPLVPLSCGCLRTEEGPWKRVSSLSHLAPRTTRVLTSSSLLLLDAKVLHFHSRGPNLKSQASSFVLFCFPAKLCIVTSK